MAVDGSLLVPLYCTDDSGQKALRHQCRDRIAAGAAVALSDGTTATVDGPFGARCGGGEVDPFPALIAKNAARGSLWAIHPASASDSVHAAPLPSAMTEPEAETARAFFVSRVQAKVELRARLDDDDVPDALIALQAPTAKRGHWIVPGAASRTPSQVEAWRPGTRSRLAATLETPQGLALLLVRAKAWRLYTLRAGAYHLEGGWSCD